MKSLAAYPSDWKVWWSEKSRARKVMPALLVAIYWLGLYALHGLRGDHLNSGLIILALSYGGRSAETLMRFVLPLLLTAIVYDSQRFYSDFIRGTVRVSEPHTFDKFFFGITTAQGVLTPNEWWQLHTNPILDIITGFTYIIYVPQYTLVAAYFYFAWKRTALRTALDQRIYESAPRMMWAFLWLNVLGYTTYYWYPAAPPWYVATYGFGPPRFDVLPSMAGCIRFDQALGTSIFSEWYGRSADVFGAVPSLHVAYPMLASYYAFQFKRLRAFNVGFFLLMSFSAVYLNHHYILDIIWGATYAILVGIAIDWVARHRFFGRRFFSREP